MKLLLSIFCFLLYVSSLSQLYKQWGSLTPGAYHVGFKVYNCYDYGRHIEPVAGTDSSKKMAVTAKPINIFTWYPANVGTNSRPMLFAEYTYLTKQVNNPNPLTAKEKQEAREIIKMIAGNGAGTQLQDADVAAISNTPAAAIYNGMPLHEKFPVLICGIQGGPSLNNVLFEYLASKGYIVIASAGTMREGKMEAYNPPRALLERLGDMEYLTAFAHNMPNADSAHIGLIGVNFEGMTALLYQMKNGNAQAVVSLDGWEGKRGSKQIITDCAYYEAASMRVPYFSVMQDEKDPPEGLILDRGVYDSLLNADRYYYVLNEMRHAYLIAGLYILPNLPQEKITAYHFLYESIGHFFDAYLKHDNKSLAYLKKAAAENNIPEGIIKTEIKMPALPGPSDR